MIGGTSADLINIWAVFQLNRCTSGLNPSTLKLLIGIVAIISQPTLFAADGDPDIAPAKRLVAAMTKIDKKSDTVAVYVKGLVCSSCSIGVKIQLRKLDGVDKSKLEKGVKLDVKTQLVTIALKEGDDLDRSQVSKAVSRAGYEAGAIFHWDGSKVQKIKLTE